MRIITEQPALEALCEDYARAPYVTVDTEFLRERTYWPQLCLIQLARPGDDADAAAIVDPLAEALDLAPVLALMRDPDVIKVFHAARQDVEIFHNMSGAVPWPMFDTQVAAMVCGYGDQVGYETLVRRIARASLDKSSRFTDWARRPLSPKQLDYALADVTHLRVIYERLADELKRTGRGAWVAEEMGVLTDPATYVNDPAEAWRRLRTRSTAPRFLACLKALAAWREREAQARDVPRGRVLKDDALLEIAAARPKSIEELSALRMVQREGRKPAVMEAMVAVVAEAETAPAPAVETAEGPARQGAPALVELLRVLLKARCDAERVAQKLVASGSDLEALAAEDEPDIPALRGWRRELFGEAALRLKRGEVALSADAQGVRLVELTG